MKNNKALVFILVCVAAVLTGLLAIPHFRNRPVDGKPFALSDYGDILAMKEFSSDLQMGAIADGKDAAEKAEAVWLEVYGDTVEDEKPYVVSRDDENGVWFVTGSLPSDRWGGSVRGGTACILIRDDGTVLAVWHEK